jgi:hypothetical protein
VDFPHPLSPTAAMKLQIDIIDGMDDVLMA